MRYYLRSRRMKINSTMNDMAKKLDISESYYSLIENGDRQTDTGGDRSDPDARQNTRGW